MDLLRRVGSLVVGVVCVALAGCSPSPVASPSPSPSATLECVPEAGGDPVSCGPIEFEQAQRRDALYAEAEAVYRRYWAEKERLETEANPTLTPELEAVTAGVFRDTSTQLLAQGRGRPRLSGEPEIIWVRRLPGLSSAGSVVALSTCTDASRASYANPEGAPKSGLVSEHRYYFARDESGGLRIVDSEYRSVQSC